MRILVPMSVGPDKVTSDQRAARTRARLRRSAITVIHERGFAAARVFEIAARASVNRATFYAHFNDKFAMVDVLVREDFRRRVGPVLVPASGPDRVAAVAELMMEWASRTDMVCMEPAVRVLVRRAVHAELRIAVREALLTDSIDPAHADASAVLVGGAVFASVDEWVREGRLASTRVNLVGEIARFVGSGVIAG